MLSLLSTCGDSMCFELVPVACPPYFIISTLTAFLWAQTLKTVLRFSVQVIGYTKSRSEISFWPREMGSLIRCSGCSPAQYSSLGFFKSHIIHNVLL